MEACPAPCKISSSLPIPPSPTPNPQQIHLASDFQYQLNCWEGIFPLMEKKILFTQVQWPASMKKGYLDAHNRTQFCTITPLCNARLQVMWSVFTQPSVSVLLPLTVKVTISLLLSLTKANCKTWNLAGKLPSCTKSTETLSFQGSVLSEHFYKGVFVCLARLRPQRSWKSRLAAGLEGFNGGGALGCLHTGALQLKSQS